MSLSTTRVQAATVPGAEVRTVTSVTFDSSYAEGGETLTAAELGLGSVTYANCTITNGSEEATVRPGAAYYSGGKLHLIDDATGKEVASTKNMEKVVVQVEAFGTRP